MGSRAVPGGARCHSWLVDNATADEPAGAGGRDYLGIEGWERLGVQRAGRRDHRHCALLRRLARDDEDDH